MIDSYIKQIIEYKDFIDLINEALLHDGSTNLDYCADFNTNQYFIKNISNGKIVNILPNFKLGYVHTSAYIKSSDMEYPILVYTESANIEDTLETIKFFL